jgi:hypothetical protein
MEKTCGTLRRRVEELAAAAAACWREAALAARRVGARLGLTGGGPEEQGSQARLEPRLVELGSGSPLLLFTWVGDEPIDWSAGPFGDLEESEQSS